jgi:hypothetical protein
VVEQPVDGRGGEGLGHDRVESGWVDVAGHGQAAAFVGGVGDAVERFGGVLPCDSHPPGGITRIRTRRSPGDQMTIHREF